ncbi:MAG: sulfatase [Rhodothermales bacterium]
MSTLSRLTILLLILSVSGCAPKEPPPAATPNVLLIVIDDLGWTDVGAYGSSFYRTPAIDGLAQQGIRLTQFYSASPVCSPTRASLMTGRSPARLQITNWIGGEQNGLLQQAEYRRELPLSERTIGEVFRDAGYRTGYVGKWHLGQEGFMPEDQGFEWTAAVNHAGQPGSYFPPYKNDGWPITNVPDLDEDGPGDYLTDRLTDKAVQFLESDDKRPFMLVMAHYAVHTPLQAPDSPVDEYRAIADGLPEVDSAFTSESGRAFTKMRQDNPTYAAMIDRTDASVRRLLDTLVRMGVDSNTIVVFVSDNGGLSTLPRASANTPTSNAPLRAGKGWLYEGGIRIPMIVRLPDNRGAGTEIRTPASTEDILPTLADLAGIKPMPDSLDGVSLVPALEGRGIERAGSSLYWHFPHYHGSGNRPSAAIREGDYKLIEWFEDGKTELYDLQVDESESHDLSDAQPALASELEEKLNAWLKEVGAKMPTGE